MTKNKYAILAISAIAAISVSMIMVASVSANINPPRSRASPEMIIELNENVFQVSDGGYVLKADQGDVIAVPFVLMSLTDRVLEPEFKVTYGPGNVPPVLPPGVHAVFDPASLTLPAKLQLPASLILRVDNDAPDGKYPISVIAFAEGTDTANSFTLVVGRGSEYEIAPDGPIIPPKDRAP
jgi:hypothetical protein